MVDKALPEETRDRLDLAEHSFKELEKTRDKILEARDKDIRRHKQTLVNSVTKLAKMFLDLEYNAWHANDGAGRMFLRDDAKFKHRERMEAIFRKAVQDCVETITLDDVERETRRTSSEDEDYP